MAIEHGAEEICTAIQAALQDKKGCLIGRNGTIELQVFFFKMLNGKAAIPEQLARTLELHAGVWPRGETYIHQWYLNLQKAIQESDVLVAGWYEPLAQQEKHVLDTLGVKVPRIPLRSLEPYYVPPEKRWTRLLRGHKVAIVNSFAETAVKQAVKAQDIWPNDVLPDDTEWISVRTGYAPVLASGQSSCMWPSAVKTAEDAVRYCVQKVLESKARIALIGCGGLGMLIGAELKKAGVIAIVLGGATQVLFGIKGKRWENHAIVKNFWNEDWVWPSEDETPQGAKQIEGGCYWG